MSAGHDKGVRSTASMAGQPVHALLVPFPIAFLMALPFSDVVFWGTGDPFWARVSFWLLVAGLVTGTLAAVFGRIDFLTIRRVQETFAGYLHAGTGGIVLLLAIVNLWLRLDDPQGNILPKGLILSVLSALLLLAVNWFGGQLLFRHLIGAVGRGGRKR